MELVICPIVSSEVRGVEDCCRLIDLTTYPGREVTWTLSFPKARTPCWGFLHLMSKPSSS